MLCLGIKNTLLLNWSTSRCRFSRTSRNFFYRKYHLYSSRALVQSHISSRFVFCFCFVFLGFFKSRFLFVCLRIQNFLYTLLMNGICKLVHSNSKFEPITCSPHDVLLTQIRLIKLGSACSNC